MIGNDARVAIVIVNWNKQNEVLNLLSSLERFNYKRHDIILVDNASTDDSVRLVRSQHPDIRLLVNPANLGGSGGFNTGLRYVLDSGSYSYVWLLDNDVEVMEGALEALLAVAERDERVAIVGSKILHADDVTVISEVGARISRLTSFPVPMLFNQPDKGQSAELEVDYVAACSLLARVKHVREVGIMDERFFLMWDDMEWGIRFRAAGYRVMATTASAVMHRGFSERAVTTDYRYYAARNHLYFANSAYSGLKLAYYLLILSIVYSMRIRIYQLRVSTTPYALAITQAMHDYRDGSMGRRKVDSGATSPDIMCAANPDDPMDGFGHILLSTERPMPLIRELVSDYRAKYPRMRITLALRPARGNLFRWHRDDIAYYGKEVFLGKHEKVEAVVRFFDEVERPFHYQGKVLVDIDNNATITGVARVSPVMRYGIWLRYCAALLQGVLQGVLGVLIRWFLFMVPK
jgi:GT2 family glycosyltransferase